MGTFGPCGDLGIAEKCTGTSDDSHTPQIELVRSNQEFVSANQSDVDWNIEIMTGIEAAEKEHGVSAKAGHVFGM